MTHQLLKLETILYPYHSMNPQEIPPEIKIKKILQNFYLKNIDELISGEYFNLENISKVSSLHPIIIRDELAKLHSFLTPSPNPQYIGPTIELANIVKKWLKTSKVQETEKLPDLLVNEGDIVQIIGRVGGGKTFLINQMIIECLSQGVTVIYFDGANNLNPLVYRIQQENIYNPNFSEISPDIHAINFKNQTELNMMLHALGSWHVDNGDKNKKPWIFIDSLNRSEDYDNQASQTSTTQFKFADKTRRLFFQLLKVAGAIVYTSKSLNFSSLFDTIYKHEKHRPKVSGSCSKKWDNLSNKTICVDYARNNNNIEYSWINCPKSTNSTLYKYKRLK